MGTLPNWAIPSHLQDQAVVGGGVKFGENPVFDFRSGEFVRTATGRIATAQGAESLKLWLTKALITPRAGFPIYTEAFGNEAHTLIGADLPDSILFMEIERFCREALIYDPRVKSVEGFTFDRQGDRLYVGFQVVHMEGLTEMQLQMEV